MYVQPQAHDVKGRTGKGPRCPHHQLRNSNGKTKRDPWWYNSAAQPLNRPIPRPIHPAARLVCCDFSAHSPSRLTVPPTPIPRLFSRWNSELFYFGIRRKLPPHRLLRRGKLARESLKKRLRRESTGNCRQRLLFNGGFLFLHHISMHYQCHISAFPTTES